MQIAAYCNKDNNSFIEIVFLDFNSISIFRNFEMGKKKEESAEQALYCICRRVANELFMIACDKELFQKHVYFLVVVQ